MKVDFSLLTERVIRKLTQIIEWHGKSKASRCDNGPEYISHKLRQWANSQGTDIQYIYPGNPQQNAYIERFNRTVRYDWLSQDIFDSIEKSSTQSNQLVVALSQ